MKKINVGSDFSGIGAFDYAVKRVFKGNYKNVFACDMDKFARVSYIHNHGEPDYYPQDVYDRDVPKKPLDIYMTSPPCQSFSLAGKRLGKDDERGVLFFNSHEFIKQNKPRYFIFENVKGLLSDNDGQTFQEWVTMLGGKSVNGSPLLFPHEESVPYHLYYRVLNSKKHGIPQNRERVFIVGIRDDSDNTFTWPKEEHLTKKLSSVIEEDVDEKYFLSDKAVERLCNNDTGFSSIPKDGDSVASTVCASDHKIARGMNVLKVGTWRTHKDGQGFRGTSDNNCPTIPARAREDGSGQPVICIPISTPSRAEKQQNGRRFKGNEEEMFTITTQDPHGIYDGYRIRRLTPRECLRLQDFPDDFEIMVSDSQIYKQAGNSITVRVLELIISKFKI